MQLKQMEYIPDGLTHFRMNMGESLIDNCYLSGSTQFFKLFVGPWSSSPIPSKILKVLVLNVVSEIVLQDAQHFDFSMVSFA